jgi:hypothetical protein
LNQTLNASGGYVYTLSAYLQSSQSIPVTLSIGSQSKTVTAGAGWSRASLTASGDAAATSVVFAFECAPGALALFGPQVEAQPSASAYKKSTTGGVYQKARFQGDSLRCTLTAPNQNSVTVNITYVNHI